MPIAHDFQGLRFGRWFVVSRAASHAHGASWTCRCECGVERVVAAASLRSGRSRSCGCEKREQMTTHGMSQIGSLYNIWDSLVARCTKPHHPRFADYGGRGITVCDRWLGADGLKNFVADVGPRPEGLTLDRRDNNRGYEPENVRWTSYSEQNMNKRSPKVIR